MEDLTQDVQRRKQYWLIGIGAGSALALVAVAIVGWLILGGRAPVASPQSKAVDEAHGTIKDTKTPAADAQIKPCSTVSNSIADASQPSSALDLSGYWDSSNNSRYDVIQEGRDFFWQTTQTSRQNSPEERGSGSLSDTAIAAQWSGGNGNGSAQGHVAYQDEKGLAQVITWDNGAIWFRTESDGAELAHHYGLEKYDRARLLEAIRQTSRTQTNC
jgi:hypothetical protein